MPHGTQRFILHSILIGCAVSKKFAEEGVNPDWRTQNELNFIISVAKSKF